MQARQDSTHPREEAPSNHSSNNKRNPNATAQGYVTLSPARKSKERSRLERNSDRFEIEH